MKKVVLIFIAGSLFCIMFVLMVMVIATTGSSS